jgi:cobalt-zinc-cadmium efflux system outer membrane protein
MKWILSVSAAGAAFCILSAPAQENPAKQSVERLVNLAIQRNRDLLATQERIQEARALLRQAGVRPAPTLELEGATGRPLGTKGEEEYSAGYFYPLETSGKREKRMQVAEHTIALAEAEYQERLRNLKLEIRTTEIDAIAEREKLAALNRTSRVNQDAYRLVEARVQKGDAAALDQQLLAVEDNRMEAQRLGTEGRSEAATFELKRIIGLKSDEPAPVMESLDSTNIAVDLSQLKQLALEKRPDLHVNRLLEQQGNAEIVLTEALGKADITLSARYTLRNSAFDKQFGLDATGALAPLRDRDNIVSVGVSIPLLTRSRNQGNVDAAISRQRAARLRREYLEDAIPLEIEAAYRRWRSAQNALAVLNQSVVDQSAKNLETIRKAYQLGQLRLLDVLNEQRRLLDTELGYTTLEPSSRGPRRSWSMPWEGICHEAS